MNSVPVFFTRLGDRFEPTSWAVSPWSEKSLSGPPVCGLLARELENSHCSEDFFPARISVELHRAVPFTELSVESTRDRDGSRVRSARAVLKSGGAVVAAATAVFLRRSVEPTGSVWSDDRRPAVPPAAALEQRGHLFGSDDHAEGWSVNMLEHRNASRKRKWLRPIPVVEGEACSRFVAAVMAGEQTSVVTNWGTEGIAYINVDVSIVLARLPVTDEMGVEAQHHMSCDGVANGSAVLYDIEGSFGSCTVTAISNAANRLNSSAVQAVGSRGDG